MRGSQESRTSRSCLVSARLVQHCVPPPLQVWLRSAVGALDGDASASPRRAGDVVRMLEPVGANTPFLEARAGSSLAIGGEKQHPTAYVESAAASAAHPRSCLDAPPWGRALGQASAVCRQEQPRSAAAHRLVASPLRFSSKVAGLSSSALKRNPPSALRSCAAHRMPARVSIFAMRWALPLAGPAWAAHSLLPSGAARLARHRARFVRCGVILLSTERDAVREPSDRQ